MGANDQKRREEALELIDTETKEYIERLGKFANTTEAKKEILEKVSEKTHYSVTTLRMYMNDRLKGRRYFKHGNKRI